MKNPAKYSDLLAAGLKASSELSLQTGHPGLGIRPCIASLLDTSLSKGDFPNRSSSAVVIASELRRIGQNFDDTVFKLSRWNERNKPPLKPQEIERAAGNAFTRDYNYGCGNSILLSFCCDRGDCPFVQGVQSKKKRPNDLVFIDYGWPEHLTHLQTIIYFISLPYLEKTRRVGRGGRIFANHHQIASGGLMSVRRVGENLRVLEAAGLIEYKPGNPRKWEGMASEIRRVFPVPRPTRGVIQKLKEFKQNNVAQTSTKEGR